MLLLLLSLLTHATAYDPCTDFYSYACKQPSQRMNDGTGSADPVKGNLKYRLLLRERFTKLVDEIKKRAAKDPKWAQSIAQSVNEGLVSQVCDSSLKCFDRSDVQYGLKELYTTEDIGLIIPENSGFLDNTGFAFFGDRNLNDLVSQAQSEVWQKMKADAVQIDPASILEKMKPYLAAQIQADFKNSADRAKKLQVLNNMKVLPYDPLDAVGGDSFSDYAWSFDPTTGNINYSPSSVATIDSIFNLVSSMGHEVGHAFDPCSYSSDGPYSSVKRELPFPYESVVACLRDPRGGNAATFDQWLAKNYHPSPEPVNALDKIFLPKSPMEYRSFGDRPPDWFGKEMKSICLGGKKDYDINELDDFLPYLPAERLKEFMSVCLELKNTLEEYLPTAPEVDQCHQQDQIGETFADLQGVEFTASHIEELTGKTFSKEQYRAGFANMFRDLCTENREDGSFDSHPFIKQRFDFIMGNSKVRHKMGCDNVPNPRTPCSLNSAALTVTPASAPKRIEQ